MMKHDFENAVRGIPAGLMACRLGGEGLHICAASGDRLWLRCCAPRAVQGALEVCFRRMDGRLHNVIIEDYRAGEAGRDDCGALLRLSFENSAYRAEFCRAMTDYAAYIQAFAEGNPGVFLPEPAEDDVFSESGFDFSFLRLPEDREICISLHEPALYDLYLNHPPAAFLEKYAREKGLKVCVQLQRLYIGNAFCRQLFPDAETLGRLLARAKRDRMAVTLVTAPDPRIPDALLEQYCGEMLVNDWGLLYRLRTFPQIQPLLGTLLNKRRKDPRISSKPGIRMDMLRENVLNDADFRAFLQEYGVQRWEFERCGYDFDVPPGKCSLHLPWYQTNTSVYCPLRALCETGDRGSQSEDTACAQYCRNNFLRYPAYLKIMGRWNSLFALDDRPLVNPDGFDRIVLNL